MNHFSLFIFITFIINVTSGFAQREYLVTIDPVTGFHTKINNLPDVNFINIEQSTYDRNSKRFIFNGVDFSGNGRLYCVDAVTGVILSNPIALWSNSLAMHFDHTTNILYGLQLTAGSGAVSLVSIDIPTGLTTIIAALPFIGYSYGSAFFDETNSLFYVQSQSLLYSVNVNTGVVSSIPAPNLFSGYQYDNAQNELYGLNVTTTTNIQNIDPSTFIPSLVSVMPTLGYGIGMISFNEISEHLTYSDGVSLYTVDVVSGAIVWSPIFPTVLPQENIIEINYDNSDGTLYALHWGFGAFAENDTICAGEQARLIGRDFDADVQWSEVANPNIILGMGDTLYISPLMTTDYYAFSTADTVLVTVVVYDGPTVDLGIDTTWCKDSILLDVENPGYNYLWQDGSTASVFKVLDTGTYWVNVYNDVCSITDSIIIQPDLPVAQFIVDDTAGCAPISVQFTDQSIPDQSAISNWLWNFGDNNTSTQSSPQHSYAQSGTYDVSLIIETVKGCTDTANVSTTVDILELPDNFLGSDTIVCEGNQVTLSVPNSNASYIWNTGNSNQSIVALTPGLYWVTASNTGCAISDTILVTHDSISALFSVQNISGCFPFNTSFTDQSIVDLSPISSWSWSFGDNMTSTLVNPQHTYGQNGTYLVDLTVETTRGCIANISQSIDLDISFQLPQNFLGEDLIICAGDPVELAVNTSNASYNWSENSTSQSIIVTSPGKYWVTVLDNGCISTDTIVIEHDSTTAMFDFQNTKGCSPLNTNFTDKSLDYKGYISSWFWDFGDNSTSNVQNPVHNYLTSGNYTVTLEVSTANGCKVDFSKQLDIAVTPQPIADFTFFPSDPGIDEEITFEDQSIDGQTWNWNFGNNQSSTNQNPLHIYPDPGSYLVELIVENEGCKSFKSVVIVVKEELIFYVPNAFTPDGNGNNEIFQPIFTSGFNPYDFRLVIFNRWGEMLFESFDATIGWNGTYAGELVPTGTYVWHIEFGEAYSDRRKTVIGNVLVL